MTRHFFEIRDIKGKLVGELSALGVELLEQSVVKCDYKIDAGDAVIEGTPVLSLPSGFTIRKIT
jgi:hypothetical protein